MRRPDTTIDYRDTVPDAAAFKALYDSTGWGDRPVEDSPGC